MIKESFPNPKSKKDINKNKLEIDKFFAEEISEEYREFAKKVEFLNLSGGEKEHQIHYRMLAGLLTKQENEKIFLENICQSHQNFIKDNVDKIIITPQSLSVEQIDEEVGTNRRVDKIDCYLKDGEDIVFTLSADLYDIGNKEDSNCFVESSFYDEKGEGNLALQKKYGYLERDFAGKKQRMIAKEYLPGKNLVQHISALPNQESSLLDIGDCSSDLGYSMGYLYGELEGELLEDLKMENMIYNNDDPDLACRVCDHFGLYPKEKAGVNSINQITAHLETLLNLFHIKNSRIKERGETEMSQEDVINNYLDSFFDKIGADKNLLKKFSADLEALKNIPEAERIYGGNNELIEYIQDYIVKVLKLKI